MAVSFDQYFDFVWLLKDPILPGIIFYLRVIDSGS